MANVLSKELQNIALAQNTNYKSTAMKLLTLQIYSTAYKHAPKLNLSNFTEIVNCKGFVCLPDYNN